MRAVIYAVTHVIRWERNLAICFLDKINPYPFFFFKILNMCVCVFCGECGCICMISICVDDNQCDYSDWMRAITMNADWPLWTIWPISVWLSSELPCTSVCDYWLTAISVHFWLYQCMSGNQSMYVSMYCLHTKLFLSLFIFITQIILIVFFFGQINHLYDV